jgi:hypothetical protein
MRVPKSHSSYACSRVFKRSNNLSHLLQCGTGLHDIGGEHPVSQIVVEGACVHKNYAHVIYHAMATADKTRAHYHCSTFVNP